MPQQPKTVKKSGYINVSPLKGVGQITNKERKLYNRMALDSKPLKKIDYAGDFDKELAKFEKVDGVETKRDRELKDKAARQLRAKSMMRTSKPEVRETKKDMVRRKKKELGIVGQLTESELKTMKRSMSASERKMLSNK